MEATQSMFCFDFSDKVVALTANCKLGISKFYELLSEPQTNQPQLLQNALIAFVNILCCCKHLKHAIVHVQDVGRMDEWLNYCAPTLT